MSSKTLAECVKGLLDRHPGLSERQASREAGLANNAVTRLIGGDIRQPSPQTLERLAQRWGTEADYYEMMQAAGYRVPLPPDLEHLQEAELLELFRELGPEDRERLLEVARTWRER